VSWPTADLLPEEEETYTYIVSDGELIAGPHQMYAYADANCSLNEGFENNNSYEFDGVPRIYLPLIIK